MKIVCTNGDGGHALKCKVMCKRKDFSGCSSYTVLTSEPLNRRLKNIWSAVSLNIAIYQNKRYLDTLLFAENTPAGKYDSFVHWMC